MFSKSQDGADASATIYSLIETAKANDIEPFDYLKLIFKELPTATNIEEYSKLLPYNVKKYFDLPSYKKSN